MFTSANRSELPNKINLILNEDDLAAFIKGLENDDIHYLYGELNECCASSWGLILKRVKMDKPFTVEQLQHLISQACTESQEMALVSHLSEQELLTIANSALLQQLIRLWLPLAVNTLFKKLKLIQDQHAEVKRESKGDAPLKLLDHTPSELDKETQQNWLTYLVSFHHKDRDFSTLFPDVLAMLSSEGLSNLALDSRLLRIAAENNKNNVFENLIDAMSEQTVEKIVLDSFSNREKEISSSLLTLAIIRGHEPEVIVKLIKKISPDTLNKIEWESINVWTPLMYAIDFGWRYDKWTDIVKLFIAKMSPFIIALRKDEYKSTLRYLLNEYPKLFLRIPLLQEKVIQENPSECFDRIQKELESADPACTSDLIPKISYLRTIISLWPQSDVKHLDQLYAYFGLACMEYYQGRNVEIYLENRQWTLRQIKDINNLSIAQQAQLLPDVVVNMDIIRDAVNVDITLNGDALVDANREKAFNTASEAEAKKSSSTFNLAKLSALRDKRLSGAGIKDAQKVRAETLNYTKS